MQRKSSKKETYPTQDASKKRIAIVVSEYYFDEVTGPMLIGAVDTLRAWGVTERSTVVIKVPGSFEVPYGCLSVLRKKQRVDAVVAIGCVVKGETKHDEYIASAVSHSLMRLMERYVTPIAFGVLTVNNLQQAKDRSTKANNKGTEAAIAALKMALLR